MANVYDVGVLVRVKVSFTDISNAAVDPTVVNLTWSVDGGATTTWVYQGAGSIVKDSTGNYHADLDTTAKPGVWAYRWWSTGSGQSAANTTFQVTASPV